MERTLTHIHAPPRDALWLRLSFVAAVMVKVTAAAAAAGAALAFSSMIVPALHEMPEAEAVEAMQRLTVSALPPAVWAALLGTGAYALAIVALDVLTRGWRASPWLIAGVVSYLVGVVGVTVFGTAPLDDWLHALDSASLPVDAWMAYATAWVGFNNVRIVAASVSCALLVIAMVRR